MTASSNFWLQDIPQQLAALDAAALRRTRRTVAPLQGARILVDGQPMLQFCSNDYLGLSKHPLLIERSREWAARHVAGAQDDPQPTEEEATLARALGRRLAAIAARLAASP